MPLAQASTVHAPQVQALEQMDLLMTPGGHGAMLYNGTLGDLGEAGPLASPSARGESDAAPLSVLADDREGHDTPHGPDDDVEVMAPPKLVLETVSDEMWQDIRCVTRHVRMDLCGNLEQTKIVLELTLDVYLSIDQLKRILRNWPECRKNEPGRAENSGATIGRTRPKRVAIRLNPIPIYVLLPHRPTIPQSLRPHLYEGQALLLLRIDKYVKGYFDSPNRRVPQTRSSTQNGLDFEVEWKWRTLFSHCRGVSSLVQKNANFLPAPNDAFPRPKRREMLRNIVDGLLKDQVLYKLKQAVNGCRPQILAQFWNICHVLQGLASQTGYYTDEGFIYTAEFVRSLRSTLSQTPGGVNTGLVDLADALLSVEPPDLQDTIRIGCLCTTRALTSRLEHTHPAVLDAWASYYQFWDAASLDKSRFLEAYETGFREVEGNYGRDHEYTINLLCNYAITAHYLCHEDELARRLAQDLWDRTRETSEPPSWTAKKRGMAESVRILALLACIKHQNKRKSRSDMRKIRKRLGLKSRDARREWRETLDAPPAPDQVSPYLEMLDIAIEKLGRTGWVCSLMTSSLADFSGRLKLEFSQDPAAARDASRRHFELAAEIRREIILWQELMHPKAMLESNFFL